MWTERNGTKSERSKKKKKKKTRKDWWHKLILHIRWIRMRSEVGIRQPNSTWNFLFYKYIELWSTLVVLCVTQMLHSHTLTIHRLDVGKTAICNAWKKGTIRSARVCGASGAGTRKSSGNIVVECILSLSNGWTRNTFLETIRFE